MLLSNDESLSCSNSKVYFTIITLVKQLVFLDQSVFVIAVPSFMKIHVKGSGLMADLYRALVSKFSQMAQAPVVNEFQKCLPEPRTPDFYYYYLIGNCSHISCARCVFLYF